MHIRSVFVSVILPGFLAVLGIPAAVLGIIEGVADMVASFTKIVAGFIADKLGHRKTLVLVGSFSFRLAALLMAVGTFLLAKLQRGRDGGDGMN